MEITPRIHPASDLLEHVEDEGLSQVIRPGIIHIETIGAKEHIGTIDTRNGTCRIMLA